MRADPVVLPPSALRPYLGFAKLSPAALSAIARVVDQDDEFRARVAASSDEDSVGRGAWLWLTRPSGWADDLAAIEAEDRERRASRAAEQREARDERSAARRLAATQAALTRAEAVAEERRLELERLQRELDDVRRARTATDARVAELETAVAQLDEARAAAVRNLKDAEARLVTRATELKAVKARVALAGGRGAATRRRGCGGSPDRSRGHRPGTGRAGGRRVHAARARPRRGGA